MRLLITGVCGFVGSTLARTWLDERSARGESFELIGIDNFARPGSERNRGDLTRRGVLVRHGDLRCPEDLAALPDVDWVIDAAANASILAGVDGRVSSRQIFDHNLSSTINLLEFCKARRAGFVLLSTSRVYSIGPLCTLPLVVRDQAWSVDEQQSLPTGVSAAGIAESFSTSPPLSLYGASKLTSEIVALEYGDAFGFPVWINRCGVLAGAGQFGRPDQGIFAYWLNAYLRRQPLRYIGFQGTGWQARDLFHPSDLLPLLERQFSCMDPACHRIWNVGGGAENTLSLRQVSDWCEQRWGRHDVARDERPRPFDIPWMAIDATAACQQFGWRPRLGWQAILEGIADHAERNPDWLEISRG
jgi:CDP-paratose 2-epimerase